MKPKQNKKSLTLLVCLVVLIVATVGGTLAYLMASTQPVKNAFTPSKVSCAVAEDPFDSERKTNVKVRNTGDTKAYIRATAVVTWKNDKGEVYAAAPQKDTDYTIAFNPNRNWFEGDDGFWYHLKEVAPCTHTGDQAHSGCVTGVLISQCAPVDGRAPDGYYLSVEIIASAIQSAPDSVVWKEWSNTNVSVTAKDGTLTVENKQGG